MSDLFVFPGPPAGEGSVYVLTVAPESDTGLGWVWLGNGTDSITDGQHAGLIPIPAPQWRPLAQGVDANDALFEAHPVLSGPHKRATHS